MPAGRRLAAAGALAAAVVASAPLTHLTRRVPRRFLLLGLLGVFVAGTLATAAAPGYGWLVAARTVTALSQAVFWAVVMVEAAGLFPAGERGQAVAVVSSGVPLAFLLGVPAGTWIGQHAGWRVAFVAVAGVGLVVGAAVVLLIPARRPSESHAATGTQPDALGYGLLLTATFLTVAGVFTAYTYVSAFLTKVSGLPEGDVPLVLLLGGASLGGLGCSGLLLSRHPRAALAASAGILATSMLGLYALGTAGPVAAVLQAAESFGVTGFGVSIQARLFVVAAARHRHRVGRIGLRVQPWHRRGAGHRRVRAVRGRAAHHGAGRRAACQRGAGCVPWPARRRRRHPSHQARKRTVRRTVKRTVGRPGAAAPQRHKVRI